MQNLYLKERKFAYAVAFQRILRIAKTPVEYSGRCGVARQLFKAPATKPIFSDEEILDAFSRLQGLEKQWKLPFF
jgi:hypothetical protein